MTVIEKLFLYLRKQHIYIDKKEFTFQFESHPEYPSLLAVSDTLNFFNISNGALHVDAVDFKLLPKTFFTKLQETNTDTLTLVETKQSDNQYRIYQGSKVKTVSRDSLLQKWKGIVFLIENSEETRTHSTKIKEKHILLLLSLLSFTFLLQYSFKNFAQLSFLMFPILGILLSLAASKKVFNFNNSFLNQFCNGSETRSCDTVLDSSQWKIFQKINLSDLSIAFFIAQFFMFFISEATQSLTYYFEIQKIVLLTTFPIVFLSVYYQKFSIKKWCPICVSIAGIIIIEALFVYVNYGTTFLLFDFYQFNRYVFFSLLSLLSWYVVKEQFIIRNQLKSELIQVNRFKRDYTIFKTVLTSKNAYTIPKTAISLGNANAELKLILITSPFCGYCEEPFRMLLRLLEQYKDRLCVELVYNINLEKIDVGAKLMLQNMLYIQQEFGNQKYVEALNYWYEVKDISLWLKKYKFKFDTKTIDKTLLTQRSWCVANKLTFTPCLFINEFQFPKQYSLNDLPFFIEDALEDFANNPAISRKAVNRVGTIINSI
ncbi:hypothetical protein IMCC3317_15690 [Kordia antarctica]|uniref:Vitamin K epoxide reductase domain-containing protein n=1 Tax=Kordia antarctica TaxID=1218801 RepID=A0A7L4ZI62_9FLAO|nr:vitamin K epoxide reductase family protein [Kordia antarctica]QHI36210.1 hypothetical protein IMCC3317_15690 [Kordia antarctica]